MSKVFKNKKHNRVWAMALTVCLVLGTLAGTGLVSFIVSLNVRAADKVLDYGARKFYVKDDEFMVLEIVPDESMAQFGYLVSGQEPVTGLSATDLGEALLTTQDLTATSIREFENLTEKAKEEYDRTHEDSFLVFAPTGATAPQYGYYRKVTDGSGEYRLNLKTLGIVPVAPGSGHYDYTLETTADEEMDNFKVKRNIVKSISNEINTDYLDDKENGYSSDKFFEVVSKDDVASLIQPGVDVAEYTDSYNLYEKTTRGNSEAQWTLMFQKDTAGNMDGTHYRFEPDKTKYVAVNNVNNLISGEIQLSSGNSDSVVMKFSEIEPGVVVDDIDRYDIIATKEFKSGSRPYYDSTWYVIGTAYDYYNAYKSESRYDHHHWFWGDIYETWYIYYTFKQSNTGHYKGEVISGNTGKDNYVFRYNPELVPGGFREFTPKNNNEKKNTYVDYYGNVFQDDVDSRLYDIKLKESSESFKRIASGDFKTITEFRTADSGAKYLEVTGEKKVKKYLTAKANGNYDIIFYYEMERINPGETGDYIFEGLSYTDDTVVPSQYSNVILEYAPYNSSYLPPNTVKGYLNNQRISIASISEEVNQDAFKKWTLGLGYVDNDVTKGYDYDSLTFNGWYKEPECINLANIGGALTENATVYAGWKIKYGDGTTKNSYKITFDRNVPDDEIATIKDMPFDEDMSNSRYAKNGVFVYEGDKLVVPDVEPKREGYVFTGWHTATPTAISNTFDFSSDITESITLYAGWRALEESDIYGITFYSNMGPGKTVKNTGLKDMPGVITGSAVFLASGVISGGAVTSDPARTDGYVFDGWYYESACLNKFSFGKGITRSFTNNQIELYAKWIKDTEKRKITFNANKPSGVSSSVNAMPENIEKTIGTVISETDITSTPTLKGNVEKKLDDISVKVITVTPADLQGVYSCDNGAARGRSGESLISRADYIVINETCETNLRELWAEHKNPSLFNKTQTQYGYTKSGGHYTFKYNSFSDTPKTEDAAKGYPDITWNETVELLKKVSGSDRYKPCPIVFDYAIYNNIVNDVDKGKEITIGREFFDNSYFDRLGILSFKQNFYKLYLLATQANPITFYNAYFLKEEKFESDGRIKIISGEQYTDTNYWNKYTLLPYMALDSQEFKSDEAIAVASLGINLDTSLRIGDGRYSSLYNRFYVYGYEKALTYVNDTDTPEAKDHPASLAGGFLTPIFSTLLDEGGSDVKNYYGKEGAFTPAQISYYLLKNSTSYSNFTTDINVLEIEPCDTYKTSDFWFWYISRTLPNYLGNPHVTGMTSAEFNGSVLDIESNFDIVYFGVNDKTLERNLLFNEDEYSQSRDPVKKASFWDWFFPADYRPSTPIDIEVTQTIPVAFYKKQTKTLSTNFVISNSYSEDTPYPFVKTWDPAIVKNGVLQINRNKLGIYADWFGLSVYMKDTAIFGAPYYRYKNSSGEYLEFNEVGVRSSISALNSYIGEEKGYRQSDEESSGQIEKGQWGIKEWLLFVPILGITDYEETHFYIDQFYWGAKGTLTDDGWVPCDAGSTAYAGDTIMFNPLPEKVKILKYNYVYTHVGPSLVYEESTENTNEGSIWTKLTEDWWKNRLGSRQYRYEDYITLLGTLSDNNSGNNADDNASFIFSGNDITKAKYDELIEYANIGHPIVFGRDVLKKDGNVNDRMIDSSTNIYKLIKTIKNDHPNSVFEAMNPDKDDIFATTIKHFAFSIDVRGPKEYDGLSDEAYVTKNDDGSTTLEYELRITNNSGRNPNYSVAVYVDTNSDGKFSPEDEIIEDIAVINESTNTQISDTALKASVRYKLQADIGTDYDFGIAYWQLVVTDLTTRKQTGAEGKAGIKSALAEKKVIYVLQIEPISGNTVPVPRYEDRNKATLSGVEKTLNDYTKNLKDYEIVFCRKTVRDLSKALKNNSNPVVGNGPNGDVNFGNIDVIILGCGPNYEMSYTEEGCNDEVITKVDNFIASGRPVIFTNDTVSYVNVSSNTYVHGTHKAKFGDIDIPFSATWRSAIPFWGYKATQKFRETLGMDRFGVMKNRGKADELGSEKPFKLNKEQQEYVKKSTHNLGERALAQGYNNTTVAMQFKTSVNKIVPINEGQITTYPYPITASAIEVIPTRAGYYQLNLEEGDTTVWYALSSDENRGDIPNHESLDGFYYGADATNNYYLYTKGNITYSGIGKAAPKPNELKLFVNTIIAASRTGVQPTVPIITNIEKASTRKGFDYLYIDFDASLAKNDENSTPFGEGIIKYHSDAFGDYYAKRVYFTLKDYSIIDDKKMLVTCKPAVTSNGGILVDADSVSFSFKAYECENNGPAVASPPSIKFRYKSDNYGGTHVENEKYYYVDIPITDNYYQYNLYNKITDKSKFNEPTYIDKDGNVKNKNFTALDLSDSFYMKLKIVTIYSDITGDNSILSEKERDAGFTEGYTTGNEPLIGEKGVCIMRRGMFALD